MVGGLVHVNADVAAGGMGPPRGEAPAGPARATIVNGVAAVGCGSPLRGPATGGPAVAQYLRGLGAQYDDGASPPFQGERTLGGCEGGWTVVCLGLVEVSLLLGVEE